MAGLVVHIMGGTLLPQWLSDKLEISYIENLFLYFVSVNKIESDVMNNNSFRQSNIWHAKIYLVI